MATNTNQKKASLHCDYLFSIFFFYFHDHSESWKAYITYTKSYSSPLVVMFWPELPMLIIWLTKLSSSDNLNQFNSIHMPYNIKIYSIYWTITIIIIPVLFVLLFCKIIVCLVISELSILCSEESQTKTLSAVSDQLIDVKVTPHLSESEPPCCIEMEYCKLNGTIANLSLQS